MKKKKKKKKKKEEEEEERNVFNLMDYFVHLSSLSQVYPKIQPSVFTATATDHKEG